MNLELIDFQADIKKMLINTRDKNRLSHAYIFQGPAGVGKMEMAHFFAAMLYSKEINMESPSLKQIFNDEHINVYIIKPEGKLIKKEQISSLHQEFSKTSQLEGPRIYIIDEADKMNQNSQNSLLKFIEEPEEGIYGILLTSNYSMILPTITSRCQTVNFKSLDEKMVFKELLNLGVETDAASLISLLTNDVNAGKLMSEEESFLKMLELFKRFLSLKTTKDAILFQAANQAFFELDDNLKKFITILIALYEDILSINHGSLDLKLEPFVANINKYKARLNKDDDKAHLELLYDLSKKSLFNVSAKNIITNIFVNLF